jgi:hypothetical protein
MEEWWSYTISDFLLFSPRTYYRLLQRHNQTVWPTQILTLGVGFTILFLLRQANERHGPMIAAVLAVLWAWVGWGFLWNRYATINWAATYFAWLFAAEALLLIWTGVLRRSMQFQPARGWTHRFGLWLFVAAVAVYPLLASFMGRPWQQAEVFGIFPDPTVLGTLGLLLMAGWRFHWKLLVIPIVWCMISGATLWAMARTNNAH